MEKIEITKERYVYLIKCEALLTALQECGVDNWEGYLKAINLSGVNEDED